VKAEIITPLIKVPKVIVRKAELNGIPIKKAAIAPVQPPVSGNGRETKETRPILPYLSTLGRIFSFVLIKSQLKNFLEVFDLFDKNLEVGPSKDKRTTTGIILPKTEIKNVFQNGRFSIVRPIGIDPFNSDIGVIARIKTLISGDINV